MARAFRMRSYIAGVEELVELLDTMSNVAQDILEDATYEATKIVLTSATQNVPVKTGKLRDSLAIKLEKTKKASKKVHQVYSKGLSKGGVRYAFAVEGGTKKTKAQPFLRPALDENKENIKTKVSEVIVRRLEQIT